LISSIPKRRSGKERGRRKGEGGKGREEMEVGNEPSNLLNFDLNGHLPSISQRWTLSQLLLHQTTRLSFHSLLAPRRPSMRKRRSYPSLRLLLPNDLSS